MKIMEKLSGDYADGAATLAFLGDSVTHGCFESEKVMHTGFDFDAVYHNQLKRGLNMLFPNMPVNIINAGIGGDCAKNAVGRLERDVLSKNPDLTVVCFGLNDINGNIEDYIGGLDKIFTVLAERCGEIIFMTPNMLNTYVSENISSADLKMYAQKTAEFQTGGKMDKFISSATECAKSHNVYVADCYSKWKAMHKCGIDTTALLANYINHPLRKMHVLFASELLKIMIEK